MRHGPINIKLLLFIYLSIYLCIYLVVKRSLHESVRAELQLLAERSR